MGVSLRGESRRCPYSQCAAQPCKDEFTYYDAWSRYCNRRSAFSASANADDEPFKGLKMSYPKISAQRRRELLSIRKQLEE
jgi:hypothetical protein